MLQIAVFAAKKLGNAFYHYNENIIELRKYHKLEYDSCAHAYMKHVYPSNGGVD